MMRLVAFVATGARLAAGLDESALSLLQTHAEHVQFDQEGSHRPHPDQPASTQHRFRKEIVAPPGVKLVEDSGEQGARTEKLSQTAGAHEVERAAATYKTPSEGAVMRAPKLEIQKANLAPDEQRLIRAEAKNGNHEHRQENQDAPIVKEKHMPPIEAKTEVQDPAKLIVAHATAHEAKTEVNHPNKYVVAESTHHEDKIEVPDRAGVLVADRVDRVGKSKLQHSVKVDVAKLPHHESHREVRDPVGAAETFFDDAKIEAQAPPQGGTAERADLEAKDGRQDQAEVFAARTVDHEATTEVQEHAKTVTAQAANKDASGLVQDLAKTFASGGPEAIESVQDPDRVLAALQAIGQTYKDVLGSKANRTSGADMVAADHIVEDPEENADKPPNQGFVDRVVNAASKTTDNMVWAVDKVFEHIALAF